MFKTQKQFEENITVLNESDPVRGSGGIAKITDSSETTIRALIMPDMDIHIETREEGQYHYERVYAHVRKSQIELVDIIPGKTRIDWNGNEYVVRDILDYTSKKLFQNAEIEMRRRLDID